MFHIHNYRFHFDIHGLIIFLLIMIPNFIWFAVPAPNDILRNESVTPSIDMIASIVQVIMVAALCMLVNVQYKKPMKRGFLLGIIATIVLYYCGWILYDMGNVNPVVILDMCIAPCVAFIVFAIAKKNAMALERSRIDQTTLAQYDQVIYGGSLAASKIVGYDKIEEMHLKNVVIFGVGFAQAADSVMEEIKKMNQVEHVPVFYFRGGICYEKLNFFLRFMLKKITKAEKSVDYSDKKYIDKLVTYVNQ